MTAGDSYYHINLNYLSSWHQCLGPAVTSSKSRVEERKTTTNAKQNVNSTAYIANDCSETEQVGSDSL